MDDSASAPDPDAPTFARVTRRLVPLLFLGYFLAFLDRVNIGFAKLQMAGDLGLGDAVYGFGAGIFFIGYFLFEVPSNLMLARIGARRWIARIMISWGVISSAFMFVGEMHWGPLARMFGCSDAQFGFYALRFLLGVAEAGFYPGVILYLTYWYPAPRRAHVVALFTTANPISNALGAPLSGAVMQYMSGMAGLRGWQWLFLIEGVPSIVMGFLLLAILPDGPGSARWLSNEEKARIASGLDTRPTRRARLSAILTDWRIWLCALAFFPSSVGFYAINFWMPTIIQEIGLDKGDYLSVGLLAMIPYGVAAVVMVLWARHSDRSGERPWHAASALLAAASGFVILAYFGHHPVLSIAAITLIASGALAWIGVFWTMPMRLLAGTAAAGGIAMINSLANLGGFFGPDLVGRVRAATDGSYAIAFLVLAAAAVMGAILTWTVGRISPETS